MAQFDDRNAAWNRSIGVGRLDRNFSEFNYGNLATCAGGTENFNLHHNVTGMKHNLE
jgi:hypothetical protein